MNAALRGITCDTPQRTDTEAIGALLYAALTQRWPYENDAYGLTGLPKGVGLIAPDQVRAGVHRGLSELAMRALVNDGATASRQEPPCTTPEELAKAVAAMPRIRPPETAFTAPPAVPAHDVPAGQLRPAAPPPSSGVTVHAAGRRPPPPPLQSRTGKALKWAVSALLIAALGLGSWQLADTLLERDNDSGDPTNPAEPAAATTATGKPGQADHIVGAKDFDPARTAAAREPGRRDRCVRRRRRTRTGSPRSTTEIAQFGTLKPGVGIVLDLGKPSEVGQHRGRPCSAATQRRLPRGTQRLRQHAQHPRRLQQGQQRHGEHLNLKPKKPVKTQYVLVWLTKLPLSDDGNYRGRITEIKVLS